MMMNLFNDWLFWWRDDPIVSDPIVEDAASLSGIHSRSFHKGWGVSEFSRMLRDPTILTHVLRRRYGGPAIGFVMSRLAQDEAEVLTIAIQPNLRERGYSHRLLDTHIQALRRRHVEKLFLEVDAGNSAGRALYAKSGFKQTGQRKGYYQTPKGPSDALTMTRALA